MQIKVTPTEAKLICAALAFAATTDVDIKLSPKLEVKAAKTARKILEQIKVNKIPGVALHFQDIDDVKKHAVDYDRTKILIDYLDYYDPNKKIDLNDDENESE